MQTEKGDDNMNETFYDEDVWRDFSNFLGEMIAKYIDQIGIDELPDPYATIQLRNMKDRYIEYVRFSMANRPVEHQVPIMFS